MQRAGQAALAYQPWNLRRKLHRAFLFSYLLRHKVSALDAEAAVRDFRKALASVGAFLLLPPDTQCEQNPAIQSSLQAVQRGWRIG